MRTLLVCSKSIPLLTNCNSFLSSNLITKAATLGFEVPQQFSKAGEDAAKWRDAEIFKSKDIARSKRLEMQQNEAKWQHTFKEKEADYKKEKDADKAKIEALKREDVTRQKASAPALSGKSLESALDALSDAEGWDDLSAADQDAAANEIQLRANTLYKVTKEAPDPATARTMAIDEIKSRISGGEFARYKATPAKGTMGAAPQAAIDYLKANPNTKEQFKAKFGYLPEGF